MADRGELMEAALDIYPEGVALLDIEGRVVFWNRAAEVITGHSAAGILGRPMPAVLDSLNACRYYEAQPGTRNGPQLGRGTLIHLEHQRGHDVPAIARRVILRDGLGGQIGIAAAFHPAEAGAALPHGTTSEGSEVAANRRELQDRLESEFELFEKEGAPLGLLWMMVDQAAELRRTHGAAACEQMLEGMERTVANALRPGEEVGRWGDDEFLILSHESRDGVLANHAQALAGIARTAEFRWWGDRISLTLSVGAAEAEQGETLAELLGRAQRAMAESMHAGGNHVSHARGRRPCLRS